MDMYNLVLVGFGKIKLFKLCFEIDFKKGYSFKFQIYKIKRQSKIRIDIVGKIVGKI